MRLTFFQDSRRLENNSSIHDLKFYEIRHKKINLKWQWRSKKNYTKKPLKCRKTDRRKGTYKRKRTQTGRKAEKIKNPMKREFQLGLLRNGLSWKLAKISQESWLVKAFSGELRRRKKRAKQFGGNSEKEIQKKDIQTNLSLQDRLQDV